MRLARSPVAPKRTNTAGRFAGSGCCVVVATRTSYVAALTRPGPALTAKCVRARSEFHIRTTTTTGTTTTAGMITTNDRALPQPRRAGRARPGQGNGQTGRRRAGPADRRLYALRDITATVESIPLMASSIMSKKVAEGTQSLLLDVKVGTGAFMTDLGQARLLGSTMIEIGQAHGVRTAAMLTAMDTPLGRAVGNAGEVAEALDVLGGGGPADVRDLSVAEAEAMLQLAGIDGDPAKAL